MEPKTKLECVTAALHGVGSGVLLSPPAGELSPAGPKAGGTQGWLLVERAEAEEIGRAHV